MDRKWTVLIAGMLFVVALALRLPDSGSYLTPDETYWAAGTARFVTALEARDWAATIITGHPAVTTVWAGTIGLLANRLLAKPADIESVGELALALAANPTRLDLLPWLRLPIALATALGIVIIYLLTRRLTTEATALLGAAFLVFSPFLTAHSRVLHQDALLTMGISIAWLALLVAVRDGRRRYFALSGIAFGLAVLTKSPALVMGPLMLAWILIARWRNRTGRREALRDIALDLAALALPALATVVLLWPALWVTPIYALQRVWNLMTAFGGLGHELGSYWLGKPTPVPGRLFYVAILLWRTTPVTLIGLALAILFWIGQTVHARRSGGDSPTVGKQPVGREMERRAMGALFLAILWFGFWISLGDKKLGRYLLPIFPFVGILAAWGWVSAVRWGGARIGRGSAGRRQWIRAGSLLLAGTLVLFQAVFALSNRPSYLTAYNPLLGGLKTARQVFIVGWGEGLEQAAAALNQDPDAAEKQAVAWYGKNVFGPFFQGESYDPFYDLRTAPELYAHDIDYVVTYVNQMQRDLLDESVQQRLDAPRISIEHSGAPLAQVYDWPKPFAHTSDLQLAPGLRLLGWSLGELDQSEGVLPVHLYWDAGQVQAEESTLPPVVVWMKDASGEVWTKAEAPVDGGQPPQPGWLDLPVIAQTIDLTPPSALMPGEYRVEMAPEANTATSLGAITLPPARLTETANPALNSLAAPVAFSDNFALVGYELTANGRDLTLDLLWTPLTSPDRPLQFFVHVINEDEAIIAQHDGPLGALPDQGPISWTTGDLFRQRVRLALLEPHTGSYCIYIGLYEPDSGQRLPITAGAPSTDDRFLLLEQWP